MTRNSTTSVSLENENAMPNDIDRAEPMQIALISAISSAASVGAGDRAHAADHHDDEGVADGLRSMLEVGRLARQLQRAAQAREHRAEREHRR